MNKTDKIFVAGGDKVIGAAVIRCLQGHGYDNLIGLGGEEPDLTDQSRVDEFFAAHKPDYVFVAGGKSGGISYNQNFPADLIYDNLRLETNVIPAAHAHGVKKLLYLASSCCYPKECPQPMREDMLMTGPLEPTNEPYAIAKIAGISLCRAYRSQHGCDFIVGVPANYFGPGDDFSPENSHVIGALIRRMDKAARQGLGSVEIWGTGRPRREFVYVDDLAEACLTVMDRYSDSAPINLGPGGDLTIMELAELVKDVTGYTGELRFNADRPDGMMKKMLDSTKLLEFGWTPRFSFEQALRETYDWFLSEQRNG